jgi:hypothetical protein
MADLVQPVNESTPETTASHCLSDVWTLRLYLLRATYAFTLAGLAQPSSRVGEKRGSSSSSVVHSQTGMHKQRAALSSGSEDHMR